MLSITELDILEQSEKLRGYERAHREFMVDAGRVILEWGPYNDFPITISEDDFIEDRPMAHMVIK